MWKVHYRIDINKFPTPNLVGKNTAVQIKHCCRGIVNLLAMRLLIDKLIYLFNVVVSFVGALLWVFIYKASHKIL